MFCALNNAHVALYIIGGVGADVCVCVVAAHSEVSRPKSCVLAHVALEINVTVSCTVYATLNTER